MWNRFIAPNTFNDLLLWRLPQQRYKNSSVRFPTFQNVSVKKQWQRNEYIYLAVDFRELTWYDTALLCDDNNTLADEPPSFAVANEFEWNYYFNFSLIADPNDPLFEEIIKVST